ncbi:MAG: DNA/RNA nuclease SfsA [Firmicutes bacterium]|nr:DNA/RNA nuclease SfsA [Bacillota bacterium]
MQYENIKRAVFLSRPNRFIANIEIDGRPYLCHVKNTGRCRELLLPGVDVVVQKAGSAARKTPYDLIGVWKGERFINIDAAAPNQVVAEWLPASGLLAGISHIRPETVYGDSRFDFYLESAEGPAFIEVKGVTLEENGVVRFPDAPTERGCKHLLGLIDCVKQGYAAFVIFVVQMENVRYFEANAATDPAFAAALAAAHRAGVRVLAYSCQAGESSLFLHRPIPVKL